MGMFTVIPESTFEDLQLDAGVLLKNFNPAQPAVVDADIITATTGGINVICQPTFADFFEDVDNAPNNTKEGKKITGWDCRMSTTSIGTSPELIKMALGAADIDGTNTYKIVPHRDLQQTDFIGDLWWVGDKADGGMVAVRLMNALSTGGFNLQTTKNGKGQLTVEIMGHVSIQAQSVVPMEFYSTSGSGNVKPFIMLDRHSVTIDEEDYITLTCATEPNDATVTWTSGDTSVATVSSGVVTGVGTGNTIIRASITQDGVTYDDTCTVIVEAGE